MTNRFFLLVVIFLVIWHFQLFGQVNFHFRALRAQDGLSESTNAFVSRDSRGYIWISSLDGLNRFDGQTVKSFKPDENNPNTVLGEIGQSQFWEDKNGNLWFCTYTALNCYIRSKNHFQSWQVSEKDNTDYSFVHLNKAGELWFVANKELYHCSIEHLLQKRRFTLKKVEVAPFFADDKKFLPKLNNKEELVGFYSYRNLRGGIHYWHKKADGNFEVEQLSTIGLNNININQILQTKGNDFSQFWIISGKEISLYDAVQKRLIEKPFQPNDQDLTLNYGVWVAPNIILISTNKGLIGFDTVRRSFFNLPKSSNLSGKTTKELYLDQKGVLWVSVYGEGIYYTHTNGLKFEFISKPQRTIDIANGNRSSVLVGFENGLVTTYRDHLVAYQKEFNTPLKSLIFFNQSIFAISSHHIHVFSSALNRWEPIYSIEPQWIFSCYIKKADSTLYICTSGGLSSLKLNTLTLLKIEKENPSGSGGIVSNLYYDEENKKYYLASNQKEIWVDHRELGKNRKIIPLNARFNHFTLINSLNEYWIANSKGVLCINRETGENRWLKNQHGTLRQNIQSLAVDSSGHVWLVGNFKLLQYKLKTQTTQTYTWDDGLFAGQFSNGAITTTRSGEIWIGGKNGINIFNPKNIKPNLNLAQIALQEFKINDTPLPYRSPNEIKKLTLPWHQNNLFFHLVAIEYTAPKNNQLEYQLMGWEKSANLAGPTASIKYNRLTPGQYTLRVRAANNNGIWSAWQEKMKIDIRPPFWQTWWFQISASLLILGLIWGAIQLYIRAKLQKERFLSAQKDARIKEQQRILREVHDDLGSSLTQIQHIRRRATQEQAENRNSEDFEELYDLSTDLFARLGEVIVNIDEGPIQLATLLQKIERHARRYLSIQNNLDTIIEIPAEIPNLELRNETRQHLELIVKECLHNIVKHAQATQVQLRFQIADKLSITIQDNGVGIVYLPDQAPLKSTNPYWQKQGNGLRNLRQRASELGGSIFWQNLDPGTLIQLEVPLSK